MSNHNRFIVFFLITVLFLMMHPQHSSSGSRSFGYEEKLLMHINQYRAAHGLNPLSADETLARLAQHHSNYMESGNTLSHEHFNERFQKSGRSLCVENVGWNYETPEEQFRAWKSSPEHNKNLLNKKITLAGISQTGPFVTFFACE